MSSKNEYEIQEEESVEERECSICQDVPERVIHLSCEHIVCLECATKIIFSDKDMNEVDLTEIQCEICEEITPLSEEVQESIIEFLNEGLQNQEQEDSEVEQSDIQEQESQESECEEENVSQNQQSVQNQENIEQDDEENNQQEDQSEYSENQDLSYIDEKQDSCETQTDLEIDIKCKNHISESCIYYDTEKLQMFCAQCLIQEKTKPETVKNLKSIKKNYKEILQNFEDLVTQINLRKNLLNNKKKDLQLRRNNCQEYTDSQKKKLLMNYQQIYDMIEENKLIILKEFDQNSRETIKDLHKNENDIQQSLEYLKKVLKQVNNIQNDEESSIQDTIEYYFNNFQKLQENLQDKFTVESKNQNEVYKNFKQNIENLKEEQLQKSYKQILQNLKTKLNKKDINQIKSQDLNENVLPKQNELLKKWRVEHQKILKQKENILQPSNRFNILLSSNQTQKCYRSRTPQKSYDFNQKFQNWKQTPLSIQQTNNQNVVKYKRKTFKQVEQKLNDFKLCNFQQKNSFTGQNFFKKQQVSQLKQRSNQKTYVPKRSTSNFLFKFM